MRLLLLFLLSLQCGILSAQTGNYFLSHYSPNDGSKMDKVCFQIVQHDNGLMYFATRGGIMEFDGRSWNLIQGKGAVYTMTLKENGELFWGGASGYGIVTHNENGLLELKQISENAQNIFQSIAFQQSLFFISQETIFFHRSADAPAVKIQATEQSGAFQSLFELYGHVYVTTSSNVIYQIDQGKLTRPSSKSLAGQPILFTTAGKGGYLVGSSTNKVYIVNKSLSLRELKLEDQEYIDKSVLVNAQWVNDELFVVGTLRGGMIFINAITGKTEEIINYSTGLPDNEIFALTKDRSSNIWAAHEYGYTRVAPYLPFRSFSHYPGLQGNLLCAISFGGKVFVGTSLGLFSLEREDVYEDVSYYVEVPRTRSNKKLAEEQEEKAISPSSEPESKRKGFFSFLRRSKSTALDTSPTATERLQSTETKTNDDKGSKTIRLKRTEKVLLTSHYAYKKISGIEAKVTQLLRADNKLIAAGLAGTYEVQNGKAVQISDEPARFIFNTTEDLLLISTYADEVLTMKFDGRAWKDLSLLQNLKDQINYIFEGNSNDLWLCALDKMYRLNYSHGDLKDIKIVSIENPNYDEFVGIPWNNETVVANAQGFYKFDSQNTAFQKIDTLSASKAVSNYFANDEAIWYQDVHGWKLLDPKSASKNLGFLNLFQNLRYLSSDGSSGNLWMITASNELFRFYGERLTPYESGFPILMKSFVNDGKRIGDLLMYNVDQENSSVTTEVVQPDYLAALAIEYRYRLKGLEEETWTTWSNSNNSINFPYLPAGEYTLEVQAKDILGSIKDMKPIKIEVLPPYWKRTWFYALEFVIFASLVLLSFRLSSRYRIVSRLLMLLTIIMLIQFIENIVGETFQTRTSPVIDFIIQVVIAMMVLPVEGYLREMMLRSLESNRGLRKLIWQKQEGEVVDETEP